jgi:hypothetical protein
MVFYLATKTEVRSFCSGIQLAFRLGTEFSIGMPCFVAELRLLVLLKGVALLVGREFGRNGIKGAMDLNFSMRNYP